MKFYVTNFGEGNLFDGNINHMLGFISKYSLHQMVYSIEEADVILLAHTYQLEYTFQPQNIGNKPIVILDFVETGSGYTKPYFLAFHPIQEMLIYSEYAKLNAWLQDHISNIKMYFKREYFVHSPTIPTPLYPIDFTSNHPLFWKETISSFDEFWSRPCAIAFIWGYSNESRKMLHGEMMKSYGGGQLCLDERVFDEDHYFKIFGTKEIIALMHIPCMPHHIPGRHKVNMRMSMERMMYIYSNSRITISMWGVGQKCFRDAEAPFDSVMAIQKSDCHYTYPWIHNKNCIFLPNKTLENGYTELDEYKSIETMNNFLNRREELYDIYLNSKKNSLNYRIDNYLTKYVIPKLEKVYDL